MAGLLTDTLVREYVQERLRNAEDTLRSGQPRTGVPPARRMLRKLAGAQEARQQDRAANARRC
jgi:hypothetical protein